MKKRKVRHTKLLLYILVLVGLASGFLFIAIQKWGYSPKNTPQAIIDQEAIVQPNTGSELVDGRAGFSIFTNGTERIFSESKYHNQSPDVYIAPDETNIIKVKKEGVTWQQFFDSLPAPMKVTPDCLYTGTGQSFCNTNTKTLRFFLNGKQETNLLQQTILDGDKVLLIYGDKNTDVTAELSKVPSPR